MNEYSIRVDEKEGVVSICLGKECHYLDAFISIWVDDDSCDIPSPFNSIDDARLFAEILIKMMRMVE